MECLDPLLTEKTLLVDFSLASTARFIRAKK